MISDHFQPWRHQGGHAPFSLVLAGAVGERTEPGAARHRVLTPTFRYNPAVVAQAFATLGCLYPGRVMLGVGTGEAMNEVAVGAPAAKWPEYKERFARHARVGHADARALDRGAGDLRGRVLQDDQEPRSTTSPDTPVPVYVAAGGPHVARYAGRAGDGFICT